MKLLRILSAFLLTVPVTVSACEGDCIDGVTNAWLQRYASGPLYSLWRNTANRMSDIMPNQPGPDTTMSFIQPIFDAYQNMAYDNMENAIFPSFFHGKCLDKNGVEPPGCPNPDCSIVCGTPGSMIHFFSQLRYIAFNATTQLLKKITSPGSDTYQQVENLFMQGAQNGHHHARNLRVYGRSMPIMLDLQKRKESLQNDLRMIFDQVGSFMEKSCGGTGRGDTNGLPQCSWEDEMKQFILSYP